MKRKNTPPQQISWQGGAAFALLITGMIAYSFVLHRADAGAYLEHSWEFVLPGVFFLLSGILLSTYLSPKSPMRLVGQVIFSVGFAGIAYGLAVLLGFLFFDPLTF